MPRLLMPGRAAAVLLVLAVTAGLGGCAGDDQDAAGGGATASTAAVATTAATTAPTPTGAEPTGAEPAVPADGRHPVYLVRVDARGRTVTFDLIQFFTGEAAAKAAAEDHQESPPPNDYYIRNTSPRLRTLPVLADAPITVNVLAAEQTGSSTKDVPVTLAKLASWFPNPGRPTFWITVRDGRVTRIAEQYLP
jgi:hypothetical protein